MRDTLVSVRFVAITQSTNDRTGWNEFNLSAQLINPFRERCLSPKPTCTYRTLRDCNKIAIILPVDLWKWIKEHNNDQHEIISRTRQETRRPKTSGPSSFISLTMQCLCVELNEAAVQSLLFCICGMEPEKMCNKRFLAFIYHTGRSLNSF